MRKLMLILVLSAFCLGNSNGAPTCEETKAWLAREMDNRLVETSYDHTQLFQNSFLKYREFTTITFEGEYVVFRTTFKRFNNEGVLEERTLRGPVSEMIVETFGNTPDKFDEFVILFTDRATGTYEAPAFGIAKRSYSKNNDSMHLQVAQPGDHAYGERIFKALQNLVSQCPKVNNDPF